MRVPSPECRRWRFAVGVFHLPERDDPTPGAFSSTGGLVDSHGVSWVRVLESGRDRVAAARLGITLAAHDLGYFLVDSVE